MKNKILVVDDEKILCKGIKRLLESEGYAVDFALTGAEGIDLGQRNNYDLLIVDLILPDIKGLELCNKILEKKPEVKIMIMSGHYGLLEELKQRNKLQKKFIHFIRKPFESDNLIEFVDNAVRV